jgi:class 3 adenylate cyclase
MLKPDQKAEIRLIVENALDRAEGVWVRHGHALDEAMSARADSIVKAERVPSKIPGHAVVTGGEEQVDTFIALVADIRHSSDHLNSAIGGGRPSQLKRVVYETSALLPALERTIQYRHGSVTEYLGDGILALFRVSEDEQQGKAIKNAYRAARNCIDDTREIVNGSLKERYNLPPLALGIGLAMSKAVVALVGLDNERHAKAVGQCVYRATKLSSGFNSIYVDKVMNLAWPISKEGGLTFELKMKRGVEGYRVSTH